MPGFIFGLCKLFHWSIWLSLCQYHVLINIGLYYVLKSGNTSPPALVFLKIVLTIQDPLSCYMNSRMCFYASAKAPLRSWQGSHWTCRFLWEVLALGQHWVFYFMSKECLSSYVVSNLFQQHFSFHGYSSSSEVLSFYLEGISCREIVVLIYSLNFCFSGDVLISPSLLKGSFPRYKILDWQVVFFSILALWIHQVGLPCWPSW